MIRQCASTILLLAAAAIVAGCDDGIQAGSPWQPDTGDDDDDTGSAPDSDSDSDTGTAPDDPTASLAGTWGMLLDVSVLQGGLPILGSSPVESRNWYLVEATPDGDGGLVTSERLCAVQLIPETWVNHPVVPPAFVEHVAPLERRIGVGDGSHDTAWVSDRVCEVRGARLCDPAVDPLPGPDQGADGAAGCDEPCDGAACDQDEDGMPGMTTWLTGFYNCAVHATHRWCSRLEGVAKDEDAISGLVTGLASEQVVLGSSSTFCQTGSTVAVPDPCAARQYFEMVRLPENAACEDVLALTGCDEDAAACAADPALPLDPRGDAFDEPCP
ncbi:MAG TPA: hypothetical protein VM285_15030 [Polyangia bacterium]|nr:hypothetical protein [Polyangia bacterium]